MKIAGPTLNLLDYASDNLGSQT